MNDTNNTNQAAPAVTPRNWRPELKIYHPSPSGKGSVLTFRLVPAVGEQDGCVMMTIAPQKTVGDRMAEGAARFASFDWERRMIVKLNFNDLVAFLQVFRGELESLNEDKGLYHRSAAGTTHIGLKHNMEPTPTYALYVDRRPANGPEQSVRIMLTPGESLGIMIAIEQSLGLVCFGVPNALEAPAALSAGAPRAGESAPFDIATGVKDAFAA